MNNTILEKKKRVSDQVLYALIQLSSFLSIFILLVIIGYILYRGRFKTSLTSETFTFWFFSSSSIIVSK